MRCWNICVNLLYVNNVRVVSRTENSLRDYGTWNYLPSIWIDNCMFYILYTVVDRIKRTECKFWIIFGFIYYVGNKLELFAVENVCRHRKYIFSMWNYEKNVFVHVCAYLFGWVALRLWTELSGQLENTVLGRKQCKETLSFSNVRYYCVFGEH